MNEPRSGKGNGAAEIQAWIAEVAPYAKYYAPDQLITVGEDGFYQASNCQASSCARSSSSCCCALPPLFLAGSFLFPYRPCLPGQPSMQCSEYGCCRRNWRCLHVRRSLPGTACYDYGILPLLLKESRHHKGKRTVALVRNSRELCATLAVHLDGACTWLRWISTRAVLVMWVTR